MKSTNNEFFSGNSLIREAIGNSENLRAEGKYQQAKNTASAGLHELNRSTLGIEVADYDQEQLALFATLARLIASSSTSMAKRAKTHGETVDHLSDATYQAFVPYYGNSEITDRLREQTVNPDNQETLYNLEMARDVANALLVLASIVDRKTAAKIQTIVEAIWVNIDQPVDKNSSQASFFKLELAWYLHTVGQPINSENLIKYYEDFVRQNEGNDDRLATVSARVCLIALHNWNSGLWRRAASVLGGCTIHSATRSIVNTTLGPAHRLKKQVTQLLGERASDEEVEQLVADLTAVSTNWTSSDIQ